MKNAVLSFGVILFWLSWPFLYFYLRRSERARVFVATDQSVLLVRTWHGRDVWTLPGGGIKAGENPLDAAQRELMEETSILVDKEKIHPLASFTVRERGLHFACRCYAVELARPVRTQPHPPEVLEVRWIPWSALDEYHLGADVREALLAHGALLQ